MPNYPAMYRVLLHSQAEAIENLKEITDNLIKAHRQTEQMYLNSAEPNIIALNHVRVKEEGDA